MTRGMHSNAQCRPCQASDLCWAVSQKPMNSAASQQTVSKSRSDSCCTITCENNLLKYTATLVAKHFSSASVSRYSVFAGHALAASCVRRCRSWLKRVRSHFERSLAWSSEILWPACSKINMCWCACFNACLQWSSRGSALLLQKPVMTSGNNYIFDSVQGQDQVA